MERNPRVLVVDDEAYLREIIAFDLERAGYTVLQAANGREGLDIVKSETVDLVVSDVRMPSGDGIELLAEIRSLNPGRPGFVFITAYSDISSNEALHLGAEGFLRKPIERDELLEVVSQALIPCETRWSRTPIDYEEARLIKDPGLDVPGLERPGAGQIVLGQGGMFLAIKEDQPACYEIVQIDLTCPALKSGRLSGYGRVRWTRHESSEGFPAGAGIEFMWLDDSSRRDMMEFLAKNKPTAYVPLGGEKA